MLSLVRSSDSSTQPFPLKCGMIIVLHHRFDPTICTSAKVAAVIGQTFLGRITVDPFFNKLHDMMI